MKSLHEEYGSDAPKILGVGIVKAAEKSPLPARFTAKRTLNDPSVTIVDAETGKESVVSLCHYNGVRKALNDLFG